MGVAMDRTRKFSLFVCSARACIGLFRIRSIESLQYRAAALSSGSISVFWALIEITVYTVFYRYAAHREAATLTLAQMVSYIWLGQTLVPLHPLSIDDELLAKINSGDVGVELCRPLDLYFHWFAKSAAGRVGRFWWRALITLGIGLLMPGPLRLGAPVSAAGLIMFLVSVASTFLLSAAYGMLVTAVRLGITWGDGPTYMMMLVGGVLSGGYLPLPLWPDFMQGFLYVQPFAGYLDLPVRFYVGAIPPGRAAATIALQLGWTLLFVCAGRLVMRGRLRGVIIQGG
ncbi:MAG: hypothetical protein LBU58_11075 [Clostridiales bacterium]|jgi:ABC-2 type transport system permease protein|nr:hypothetical protein [Clostridiales bacterium]